MSRVYVVFDVPLKKQNSNSFKYNYPSNTVIVILLRKLNLKKLNFNLNLINLFRNH